jgi:hypothetical protein
LDGILSILEGAVFYFKLCAALFYPNSNTKLNLHFLIGDIKDKLKAGFTGF